MERGEKGTSAVVVAVKGIRDKCFGRGILEYKSLLFAVLFLRRGYFSSIFVVQEYVYVDQA
jgi:hypothetical protein